ncbi:MAG: tRNA adenosine(34) deaminase TadA [Desulfobacteraceae bacterium]|nr:tRNA adenosine(34) deaminase TadA [Desulfobacteraceae bacterium]
MDAALEQAEKAGRAGEVPVGAVVTDMDGEIIGSGFNRCIQLSDPTAHAEILAIREAARHVKNYRLLNAALYVTNEPCIMCMGAVIHARIALVVYGAKDPGWGAAGSVYDFAADCRLNHAPEIIAGIRENRCREIMVNFFAERRKKQP